jgi:hypothetical protein
LHLWSTLIRIDIVSLKSSLTEKPRGEEMREVSNDLTCMETKVMGYKIPILFNFLHTHRFNNEK